MARVNKPKAGEAELENPPLGPATSSAGRQQTDVRSEAGGAAGGNPPLELGPEFGEISNPPLEPQKELNSGENPPLGGPAGGEVTNPPLEPHTAGPSSGGASAGDTANPSLEKVSGEDETSNPPLVGVPPPGGGVPSTPEGIPLRRELVVIVKSTAALGTTREGTIEMTAPEAAPLANLLASEHATIRRLFGTEVRNLPGRADVFTSETPDQTPDLSTFYRVDAPDERLDELAARLRQLEIVEAAYVKPPAEPAQMRFNAMAPRAEEAPAVTPDFTARQIYLDAATAGIDAHYAWTVPGGAGQGVNVIDLEWGWRFTHEDLVQNQGGVISGANSSASDHGTAVLGEISGDRNAFGITGISPDAVVRAVSLGTHSDSEAIVIAADNLNAGDIILLEVHRPGPRAGLGSGQFGYIGIEWWPDNFAAIRYAVAKGVIVVEAAGNGGQNLDDPVYDTPSAGFPATWRNPFNPANPSSGAVLVGAGMPAAGTHGRNSHPVSGDAYAERARCYFSNYGARVDAQGWGWEVTSTGYGDLQGGSNADQWYTDQFSGTSSASPIIVGVLACLQGVLRDRGEPLLDSSRAIELLRRTGSPQQDGPGFTFIPNMTGSGYPQIHPARPRAQRIGNRPDLRQLIAALEITDIAPIFELLLAGDPNVTPQVSLLLD